MNDDRASGEVPEPRRKRPPSTSASAVRVRRHRLLRKEGCMVVPVLIRESDIETFDRAGHLDARLERDNPLKAASEAFRSVLDAIRKRK